MDHLAISSTMHPFLPLHESQFWQRKVDNSKYIMWKTCFAMNNPRNKKRIILKCQHTGNILSHTFTPSFQLHHFLKTMAKGPSKYQIMSSTPIANLLISQGDGKEIQLVLEESIELPLGSEPFYAAHLTNISIPLQK